MARIQFITPGHALAVALLGNLRAGDHVLVASGTASADVEALLSEGPGTLQDWGIASSRAALSAQGELDLAALRESVQLHKPAVVLIQVRPGVFEVCRRSSLSFWGSAASECCQAPAKACALCTGALWLDTSLHGKVIAVSFS